MKYLLLPRCRACLLIYIHDFLFSFVFYTFDCMLSTMVAREKPICMYVLRERGRSGATWQRNRPKNQKMFATQEPGASPPTSTFSGFASDLYPFIYLTFTLLLMHEESMRTEEGGWVGRESSESYSSWYWLLLHAFWLSPFLKQVNTLINNNCDNKTFAALLHHRNSKPQSYRSFFNY